MRAIVIQKIAGPGNLVVGVQGCGSRKRGLPRLRPSRFADRAAPSDAQTEQVCRPAPAVLLDDILGRSLREKQI
jgi:hypothetical protein